MLRPIPLLALAAALALAPSGLWAEPADSGAPGTESSPPPAAAEPSVGKAMDAPAGLFDQAPLREHRLAASIACGLGIAGGVGLIGLGVYDLTRVYQHGFADKGVQASILEMTGGAALSSVFSFCLNIALDTGKQ